MKTIILIAVFAALVALAIFGKWFALKDALNMYPRREKPPDENSKK